MRAAILYPLPLLAMGAMACGNSNSLPGNAMIRDGGPRQNGGCAYPDDAVEPMTEDQVIWPYRWATAINLEGGTLDLDLAQAHCDTDDDMAWSPFDALYFMSAPAT